jgi:5-methyltetrahydrofolate--homocysteine methyltransferase
MVPCEKILKTALEQKCDVIGLSGLITPSLDEMVHVAREMQRQKIELPLLIGGATTSRQHTAVKIAPEYGNETVHVLDASRAVNVVAALLDPKQKIELDRKNRADQEQLRKLHAHKREKPLVSIEDARARRTAIAWNKSDLPAPAFTGVRTHEATLEELVPFIDWTFFFTAWELTGKYPAILDHPEQGKAARDLFAAAQKLLAEIVTNASLTPRAAYGFWPAVSEGDDVVLFDGQSELRFPMLRQQHDKPECASLADFVAPRETKLRDHVGAFVVTVLGAEALAKKYEASLDDYSAIIVKALADRLAEAYAEVLHARARKDWGYGTDERLTNEELIAEKYRGIRPAFGYPACPDHSEKRTLFALLGAEKIGASLTESCAMLPASSVSGLYFAHPKARYFMVGRVGKDQIASYAARKKMSVQEVERWLAPNLGYERAN